MIATYFDKEDDLGTVRSKIWRLLNDDTIDVEVKHVIEYLNEIVHHNLLSATNQAEYINDHIPGQEILLIIEDLTKESVNPHINARLFDILQINKKSKFLNAQKSIELYFEIVEGCNSLTEKRDYLLRVIQILKGLGKGNKTILMPIFNSIKQHVLKANINSECFSVTYIIEVLTELEADTFEYSDFITILQDNKEKQWTSANYDCYRDCCNALAKLQPEDQEYYGLAVADAFVAEGDELLKTPNISQHLVADKYQRALRIYKGFGIKDKRIGKVSSTLAEAQQKAVLQIYQIGNHKFQLQPDPALVFPDFDNIFQGIYWLVSMPLPSKKTLEGNLKNKDRGLFEQFFKKSTIADPKGNIVAASDENADQIYLDGKMMREIYCKTVIAPMYNHFSEKIAVSEMEVAKMIWDSKFVPEDRLSIFVRGLFHGFCGNLIEAVQILVPQIENGLKSLLNSRGIVTRKLDREVQTEKSLQYYLDELKDVLNENLLFDLDGLLNQGFGDNLRHDLAHGLCSTDRMNSYLGLYTWWLSLKMSLQIDLLMINVEQQ
jgi:hypothetical protein